MKLRLILLVIGCLRWSALAYAQDDTPTFYRGVDLSYVNEMEDCGAVYRVDGEARDPYQIFADAGANLVRVRLWHTPTWTEYSTFEDVARSLEQATALGLNTLLDIHYSDMWADAGRQDIPAAWADLDTDALSEAVYEYTYNTLMDLDARGLLPDIVQVGNETNSEILRIEGQPGTPTDWDRNARLLNSGIQAVRDTGAQTGDAPRVMLHIAQPENAEGWLLAATRAGVTDFDIVGVSYYPQWSTHSVTTAGNAINQLRHRFGKDLMIVEAAYPWTLAGVAESAGNILGADELEPDYPATPDGQRQFMLDLTQAVFANGGIGVVYWEPAWVSTPCRTLWGQGSHWENATFFDFHDDNEVLPGIEFLNDAYQYPVEVMLSFQMTGGDLPKQLYFWGDFTGTGRRLLQLPLVDGAYAMHTRLMPGTEIQYQFYREPPASPENALLPADCLNADGYATLVIPEQAVQLEYSSDTCPVVAG